MKNFNKKQKIILIVICIILLGAILYYVYGKETPSINKNEILPYENITDDDMSEEKNVQNEKIDEAKIDNIIIYITGGVKKEGVYELPGGSRISDAIEQAEGLKANADTSSINLAYKLEDGMKIKIPLQGEKMENSININSTDSYMTKSSGLDTENSSVNVSADSSNSVQKKQQKININKATQEELETLSGIGPSIANKIVQYRKENGSFKSVEDVKNVSGIIIFLYYTISTNIKKQKDVIEAGLRELFSNPRGRLEFKFVGDVCPEVVSWFEAEGINVRRVTVPELIAKNDGLPTWIFSAVDVEISEEEWNVEEKRRICVDKIFH